MVAKSGKGWVLAPCLVQLVETFDALWPKRDHESDGSIGDTAHASRESDHNPYNGVVHAVDIDEDVAQGLGDKPLMPIAEQLRASKDSRIRYVIYEGRVFKSYAKDGHAAWTWVPYTGPNAHAHHMHVSIDRTTGAEHDMRPWPIHLPEEDDMYGPAERDEVVGRLDRALTILDDLHKKASAEEEREAAIVKAIDGLQLEPADAQAVKDAVKEALREGTGD